MRNGIPMSLALALSLVFCAAAGAQIEFVFDPEISDEWFPDSAQTILVLVRSSGDPQVLGGVQVDFTYDPTAAGASLTGIDTSYILDTELSQDFTDDADDGAASLFRGASFTGGDTGLAVEATWRTIAALHFTVGTEPAYPIDVVVAYFEALDLDFLVVDSSWSGSLPFDGGSYSAGCEIDDEHYADGETNPEDVCEICDVSQSATEWSASDACIDLAVSLAPGINLMGRAVEASGLTLASEIAQDITAQGGQVLQIDKWDHGSGIWRTYDPDFPFDDFPVGPTEGFLLRVAASSTWNVTGLADVPGDQFLPVVQGYTLVAVPTDDYARASDLADALSAGGCSVLAISRWDASSQIWETHDPSFPFFDFDLDRQTGYFIRGGGDCLFPLDP